MDNELTDKFSVSKQVLEDKQTRKVQKIIIILIKFT